MIRNGLNSAVPLDPENADYQAKNIEFEMDGELWYWDNGLHALKAENKRLRDVVVWRAVGRAFQVRKLPAITLACSSAVGAIGAQR